MSADHPSCTAFDRDRRLARGPLPDVALAVRRHLACASNAHVLVFDDATGRVVDLDLRGSEDEVLARLDDRSAATGGRLARHADRGRGTPGRPRLGVVSREVTLLPRHWAWLAEQPGGASVTLRRLVEAARRDADGDRIRRSQEACYRFMVAAAGDQPGFEEAVRAVYRRDATAFAAQTAGWPPDLAAHARELAAEAFAGTPLDAAP